MSLPFRCTPMHFFPKNSTLIRHNVVNNIIAGNSTPLHEVIFHILTLVAQNCTYKPKSTDERSILQRTSSRNDSRLARSVDDHVLQSAFVLLRAVPNSRTPQKQTRTFRLNSSTREHKNVLIYMRICHWSFISCVNFASCSLTYWWFL